MIKFSSEQNSMVTPILTACSITLIGPLDEQSFLSFLPCLFVLLVCEPWPTAIKPAIVITVDPEEPSNDQRRSSYNRGHVASQVEVRFLKNPSDNFSDPYNLHQAEASDVETGAGVCVDTNDGMDGVDSTICLDPANVRTPLADPMSLSASEPDVPMDAYGNMDPTKIPRLLSEAKSIETAFVCLCECSAADGGELSFVQEAWVCNSCFGPRIERGVGHVECAVDNSGAYAHP